MNRAITLVVGAVLGAILTVATIELTKKNDASDLESPGVFPIVSFEAKLTAPKAAIAQMFEDFAAQEGFSVPVGMNGPIPDNLTIQLWRFDLRIVASNSLGENDFFIGIYPTCSNYEAPSIESSRLKSVIEQMIEKLDESSNK